MKLAWFVPAVSLLLAVPPALCQGLLGVGRDSRVGRSHGRWGVSALRPVESLTERRSAGRHAPWLRSQGHWAVGTPFRDRAFDRMNREAGYFRQHPGFYSWTFPAFGTLCADDGGFVEQWSKQVAGRPLVLETLRESLLLKEGMSPAEVMVRIGSPSSRQVWQSQEIWRYPAYSLVFEDARLKELR